MEPKKKDTSPNQLNPLIYMPTLPDLYNAEMATTRQRPWMVLTFALLLQLAGSAAAQTNPPFPTSTLFIEMEDYNYSTDGGNTGGHFISDATDGMSGAYAGWAYYDLSGAPGIDYSLTAAASTSDPAFYRTNDYGANPFGAGGPLPRGVGVQGNLTNLTGLNFATNLVRAGFSVTKNAGMGYNNNGEWYNYTRIFPTGRYAIYLRQGAPNVMTNYLDLVTSDPTQLGQTTLRLGSFGEANTGNFYNFFTTPLKDALGQPVTLQLSGQTTLRITMGTFSDILDYLAFVPVTNAAAPYIVAASPAPGQPNEAISHVISIMLADSGTGIGTSTIRMMLNGTNVTPTVDSLPNNRAMVTYDFGTNLPSLSSNNITFIAGDNSVIPVLQTNTWSFRAPRVVFQPGTLFVETEDYNYSSGQFISDSTDGMNGPYPGFAYQGFVGTPEVDYHVNAISGSDDRVFYRPVDQTGPLPNGMGIQGTGIELPCCPGSGMTDRDRGYFTVNNDVYTGYHNSGEWQNYTRVFPGQVYAVYLRSASSQASGINVAFDRVTGDPTQPNQSTYNISHFVGTNLLTFYNFSTLPLLDGFGNPLLIKLSGSNTFRLTMTSTFQTINYLAFVPQNVSSAPPYISSVAPPPNASYLANVSTKITVNVLESGTPMDLSATRLFVDGSNVTASVTSTPIAGGYQLAYDMGPQTVASLQHTATLIIADTSVPAAASTNTWKFTGSLYTTNTAFIEAEDYNYGGGQFISGPGTGMNGPYLGGAYFNLVAVSNIDYITTSPAAATNAADDVSDYRRGDWPNVAVQGGHSYATNAGTGLVLAGGPLNDVARGAFSLQPTNNHDFMWGYVTTGEWLNYTRVFPDNVYAVFLRASSGSGTISLALDQVLSDPTLSAPQTTTRLGGFVHASTGSFYSFISIPLTNGSGAPVYVHLSGTNTLRLTITGTFCTVNYIAFVPVTQPKLVATPAGPNLMLSWNGNNIYKVQRRSPLITSGAWTDVPGATNSPIFVPNPATNTFFRLTFQ
jgi:hypothetical protein